MTVESFRCSHCGKLVGAADESTRRVRCRHCGRWVPIPPVAASLPYPQIPADRSDGLTPQMQLAAIEADTPSRRGAVTATLERSMPLLTSIFFHVGLALIMVFVTIVSKKLAPEKDVGRPLSLSETPTVDYAPMRAAVNKLRPKKPPSRMRVQANAGSILLSRGKINGPVTIGLGQPAGSGWCPGTVAGGSGGPGLYDVGEGQPAHHFVYVIDRSGSMTDTFDAVSREMMNSIAKLGPEQDFHVILFNDGLPAENPPRRLVRATRENRRDLAHFLSRVVAYRRTDPVPALERAFAVLRQADPRLKGKVIFLLTDAEFPDSKKVLRVVARLNRDKQVRINTFLYAYKPVHAERVMAKIAADNGGQYRFVPAGE